MGSNTLLPDVFGGIAPETAEELMRTRHEKVCRGGQFFFQEGSPVGEFLVLKSGHAKLTKVMPEGQAITLRLLVTGSPFGAIEGLGPSIYGISAEAVDVTSAWTWRAAVVGRLLERDGAFARNVARAAASQLHDLRQRYCEYMTEPADRLVARALLRLVGVAGQRDGSRVDVDFPVSRQDVAEMAGTSLYTASRLLHHWQALGILRGGRRHIVVAELPQLESIARGLALSAGHGK